ncbi:adenosine deaminase [Streptosporangiaceae bacterium NEAU-GS5]|nr:adenosine deaminase [Streptosporangiaceae bacterium NEAU-GS5]
MRELSRLPKAHLHVHLESTVRDATLREITAANGLPIPARVTEFGGFRAFGDHSSLVRESLRTPADFRRVAREFCEDQVADGVGYAEVSFTAASHGERLGALEMPLEAVLEGLAEGREAYGLETRVILDHSRRRSVDRMWRTLKLAVRYGAVAIGVAGEELYPLAPFAEVCDAAVDAGVHLVHHAGEHGGPELMWEAIKIGHAERIGHGIRALDDPELVVELKERRIPLEVCPTSNVALGFVPSFAAHPLPRLVDSGIVVTVNTDIPSIVGTTLTEEYSRIRDVFDYDDAELAALARASFDASFAPAETKERLHQETDAWLTR